MTPGIFALLFILAMAGIVKLFPNNKSGSDAVPNDDQLTKFTAWGKISGWIMLAVLIYVCIYSLVLSPTTGNKRSLMIKPWFTLYCRVGIIGFLSVLFL